MKVYVCRFEFQEPKSANVKDEKTVQARCVVKDETVTGAYRGKYNFIETLSTDLLGAEKWKIEGPDAMRSHTARNALLVGLSLGQWQFEEREIP